MRDDQAGFLERAQEMFQKDLGSKIEEVCRFVQEQQVRFVQKEGREFNACLPTSREVLHRGFEHLAFDFEFPRDFSAFPVRLVAVTHEEL